MTDQELLDLVLRQGRARVAGLRLAESYDDGELTPPEYYASASRQLGRWREVSAEIDAEIEVRLLAEAEAKAPQGVAEADRIAQIRAMSKYPRKDTQ